MYDNSWKPVSRLAHRRRHTLMCVPARTGWVSASVGLERGRLELLPQAPRLCDSFGGGETKLEPSLWRCCLSESFRFVRQVLP